MGLHPKVAAAGGGTAVGGAIAVLIVWGFSLLKVQIPLDVSMAMSTLICGAFAVASGYWMPSHWFGSTVAQNGSEAGPKPGSV